MTDIQTPAQKAWYVVIAGGDGPQTRTVKGLDAVVDAVADMVEPGDEVARGIWRDSIYDFEEHWGCHYPDYIPWNYTYSFEDGRLDIQRLSDDDPIVAVLNWNEIICGDHTSPIRTEQG